MNTVNIIYEDKYFIAIYKESGLEVDDNLFKLIKEKYDKDDFFNFEQDIRIERKLFYDFLVR